MRQLLLILILCLQPIIGFASSTDSDINNNQIDSLKNLLHSLPHDSTRLEIMEKIALLGQSTPKYLTYAQELHKEALLQKSDIHICHGVYLQIQYYSNENHADSVVKWVNYLKPIAERIGYWKIYFNAQRLLINDYIYQEKYEFAIDEALKMQSKAEAHNDKNGLMAAYQCLAKTYDETNRLEKEGDVLEKAHALISQIPYSSVTINVLGQLIQYNKDRKEYEKLKQYLKELGTVLSQMTEDDPNMRKIYHSYYLMMESYYCYYYLGIKDPVSAKYHLEQARNYIYTHSYAPYIIIYQDAYSEYYSYLKDYQSAFLHNDTALTLLEQYRKDSETYYAEHMIRKADILKDMGKYMGALPLYEEAFQIQDSMEVVVSNKQLDEIKEMHHFDQLLFEEGKLRNHLQIIILAIVCTIVILCSVFMFRFNRIRKALRRSEKETKEAVLKTEEANEVKNRFLSNMSHAIRVPLNGVVGFSQLMAIEPEMTEEMRIEYAAIIQQNTEKLMRLVNNVLDLSRLEANMMKFQLMDFDMVQLSHEAVNVAQLHNTNLHIRFESNIEEHLIHSDYQRIIQVVVSTLTYPIPNIVEERKLDFTLNKNGETLCFKVTNSPLADSQYAGQDTSLLNDINRLLLQHFGGTYQVIHETEETPTILFTYPAVSIE